jgi:hypothetical protein
MGLAKLAKLAKRRVISSIPFVAATIIFLAGAIPLFGGAYDLNIIDTPKTYASYKGEIRFDFCIYDRGGILSSATLGLSEALFLGIYLDVGQLIGSEEAQVAQPGVLARLRITDGSTFVPPIAIGYGYFTKGEVHKVDGVTVSGFYAVASAGFFLFRNEQAFVYGLRYPIVPFDYSKPENMSVFLGTDIELSPAFGVKAEIENIRFIKDGWEEIFYNFGFTFNVVDVLTLAIELKYSPSIDRIVRLLSIGYSTHF